MLTAPASARMTPTVSSPRQWSVLVFNRWHVEVRVGRRLSSASRRENPQNQPI